MSVIALELCIFLVVCLSKFYSIFCHPSVLVSEPALIAMIMQDNLTTITCLSDLRFFSTLQKMYLCFTRYCIHSQYSLWYLSRASIRSIFGKFKIWRSVVVIESHANSKTHPWIYKSGYFWNLHYQYLLWIAPFIFWNLMQLRLLTL